MGNATTTTTTTGSETGGEEVAPASSSSPSPRKSTRLSFRRVSTNRRSNPPPANANNGEPDSPATPSSLGSGTGRPSSLRHKSVERPKSTTPFKRGDYVQAKLPDWVSWYGGEIRKVGKSGMTFDILFDDGERQSEVPLECVRRPIRIEKTISNASSTSATSALAQVPGTPKLKEGDRVSAKISGWKRFYDGVIRRRNPDGTFVVEFDDGDIVSTVRPSEMMYIRDVNVNPLVDGGPPLPPALSTSASNSSPPFEPTLNQRVEAKIKGWHKWYPGTVNAIDDSTGLCHVMFDDGEFREDVPKSCMRPCRNPNERVRFLSTAESFLRMSQTRFPVGTAVMSNPFGEWSRSYPGRIEHVLEDGTYAILFDDGDRVSGVHEADITALDEAKRSSNSGPRTENDHPSDTFSPGDAIEAKVGGWKRFYLGKIRSKNTDGTYVVDFIDGEVVNNVQRREMRPARPRSDASASVGGRDASTSEGGGLGLGDPNRKYKVGERVAAKLPHWKRWWGGVVTKYNEDENVYRIDFDDGEIYHSVSPLYMRRPKEGSKLSAPELLKAVNFVLGDRVEVKIERWQRFYPGFIAKINNNGTSYCVQFDDGERVANVKPHEMRRPEEGQADQGAEFADDDDEYEAVEVVKNVDDIKYNKQSPTNGAANGNKNTTKLKS